MSHCAFDWKWNVYRHCLSQLAKICLLAKLWTAHVSAGHTHHNMRRARAIVPMPSLLSNHAYAIVPCNCCCAHGCATMPVPMCLCQGHRAWAIVAAPVYPCHRSTKTTCHCLCHRFLFHNQRHPGCQHRFRHLPIDGAALLVQLLPILVAHNG